VQTSRLLLRQIRLELFWSWNGGSTSSALVFRPSWTPTFMICTNTIASLGSKSRVPLAFSCIPPRDGPQLVNVPRMALANSFLSSCRLELFNHGPGLIAPLSHCISLLQNLCPFTAISPLCCAVTAVPSCGSSVKEVSMFKTHYSLGDSYRKEPPQSIIGDSKHVLPHSIQRHFLWGQRDNMAWMSCPAATNPLISDHELLMNHGHAGHGVRRQ